MDEKKEELPQRMTSPHILGTHGYTFCELMKDQLIDEEHAGELYETAIKLLKSEDPERHRDFVHDETKPEPPVPEQYAILEKIASDERSHKILLKVLTERLCP